MERDLVAVETGRNRFRIFEFREVARDLDSAATTALLRGHDRVSTVADGVVLAEHNAQGGN